MNIRVISILNAILVDAVLLFTSGWLVCGGNLIAFDSNGRRTRAEVISGNIAKG